MHPADAEIGQDLGPDAVVACIDRSSKGEARLDGIQSLLLEGRRSQRVGEVEPASLVPAVLVAQARPDALPSLAVTTGKEGGILWG